MALGDVYMVKDKHHSAQGVEYLNTYFYQGTGAGISLGLANYFEAGLIPAVADLQATDINHYEVEVLSLFDPTDYAIVSIDVDGTWTVETSAPFLAIGFTLAVPTRAIKKGSKRIGPVPEDAVVNGVITDAGYIALIEIVRAAMGAIAADPGDITATYQPVVVKRVREGTPGDYTYRLPVSFGEAEFANVTATLVSLNVTSQVSRKF